MSGRVVPAAGNITFASNAVSNAVCQVFTPASNRITSLCNVAYNPSTRPPGFTSNFVPAVPGTPLNIRFFDGDSKYLTAPTVSVGAITTSTVTPNLSGGGGDSYYVTLGTTTEGSNTMSWRVGVNGTQITGQVFTVGTIYYISAYASNSSLGTSSIAVSNTSQFGIPNTPLGSVVFNITSLTSWTISGWSAPSGIQPTRYDYRVYTGGTNVITTNSSGSPFTYTAGTALTTNTDYTVRVYSYRPEAALYFLTSTIGRALAAPTGFAVTEITRTTVTYTWNAVPGATQYGITNQNNATVYTSSTETSKQFNLSEGTNTFYVFAYANPGAGYSTSISSASVTKVVVKYTTSVTFTAPTATYTVIVTGGGGGNAPGYGNSQPGGAGACLQQSVSISSGSSITFTGAVAPSASQGGRYSRFQYPGVDIIAGGGGGGSGIDAYGDSSRSTAAGPGAAGNDNSAAITATLYAEQEVDPTYYDPGFTDYLTFSTTASAATTGSGSDNSGPIGGTTNQNGNINYIQGGGGLGNGNGNRGNVNGAYTYWYSGRGVAAVSGGAGGTNYGPSTTGPTYDLSAGNAGGILIMYT